MEIETYKRVLISLSLLAFLGLLVRLYNVLVLKPENLRSLLRKQGIAGPKQSFLLGNLREIQKAWSETAKSPAGQVPLHHNYAAALFPFFEKWRKQYGDVFLFGLGNKQVLYVNQPDVVREITTCISMDFGIPSFQHKALAPLLGEGILTSNGTWWAHQRKILAPELYIDKVKGMVNLVTKSATNLIDSWKNMIEEGGGSADINVTQYMKCFSADVISSACFGTNFSKGEEILYKLGLLATASSNEVFSAVPLMRYLPSKKNRETWALEKEVKKLILQVVKERQEASCEKDLLQMVLEGAKNSDMSQIAIDRFIIDNCQNIYLAGYASTSILAAWCIMLLASNQEWQDRVRAEIREICGNRVPDYGMIVKMKQLTMVIHETLRLYPPVPVVSREALKDIKFGNISVPQGAIIWIFIPTQHTDPEIWGPDSYKFNPERFVNGITGACKSPQLYMPFGVGPRVCLGLHLAMLELKLLTSLIVSNFSFRVSPKYVHSPALRLLVEPRHGVNVVVEKLTA